MNKYDQNTGDQWTRQHLDRLLAAEDPNRRDMPALFGPGCGDKPVDNFFDWLIIGVLGLISIGFLALITEEPRPPVRPPAIEQVAPSSTLP